MRSLACPSFGQSLITPVVYQAGVQSGVGLPPALMARYVALTADSLLVANASAVADAIPLEGGAPVAMNLTDETWEIDRSAR